MTLNRVWLTVPNIPSSISAFFLFKHCFQLSCQISCCWWVPCDASEVKMFLRVIFFHRSSAFQNYRVDGREDLLTWNLNASCCLSNAYIVLIYWCSALIGRRVMEGSKAGKIYLNLSPKPWLYSGQDSIVLLCFVETSQEPVWQCCLGTHWNQFYGMPEKW